MIANCVVAKDSHVIKNTTSFLFSLPLSEAMDHKTMLMNP